MNKKLRDKYQYFFIERNDTSLLNVLVLKIFLDLNIIHTDIWTSYSSMKNKKELRIHQIVDKVYLNYDISESQGMDN